MRDARETGLRALVHHREVAHYGFLADHVRILLSWLARRQRGQLGLRTIEDRVIRQNDVGACRRRDVAEPLCRIAVGLEPEAIGPITQLNAVPPQ